MLGTERDQNGKLIIPDATELRRLISKKKIKVKDLVAQSLSLLHQSKPEVNGAVKIFDEEATKAAKRPVAGPLSGLPISIKETFGMAGEKITAGSKRMPPQLAEEDCAIVAKLRKAGAIVVSRSNIPEFAMSHETDNLLYGRTNSPLNKGRISGGSSGGEGALVGYGAVSFGVGSDIGGSIRYPAQCCGIVGFKPASGAVDGSGTFPEVKGYTKNWLAWGPLTRSVRDARLVYNVIANKKLAAFKEPENVRLLVPEGFQLDFKNHNVLKAVNRAKHALMRRSVSVENIAVPDAGDIYLAFVALITNDFEKAMHELLVTEQGEKLSVGAELVRNVLKKPTVWPGLFMTIAGMPVVRPKPQQVKKAVDYIEEMCAKYYDLLGDNGVMLLPTSGDVGLKHGQAVRIDNSPGVQGVFTPTVFCNALNLPSISIPSYADVDKRSKLPPGIMLACAPGAEEALMNAAEALEQQLQQGAADGTA